ncbi:MAG: SpoVR family protein [Ktedonobacterales bacterium]|nr:SpoVR family protein [Ktedonobacterales bacterium]
MADKETEQLEANIARAWDLAIAMGLDPFPVNFEIVPPSIMYEFGSYGLPGRFSHWTRGKAYYRMKMSYDFGLSKIYELVINSNPSWAFLLENNSVLENTFVAAHVFGHTDFFKHNAYFAHTARNMVDRASASAERIHKYEFEHGRIEVERFLDAVLAIEEHVDYYTHLKPSSPDDETAKPIETPYDDIWLLDREAREKQAQERRPANRKFPKEPTKDILLFLAEHASGLEPWQRDILLTVREEMLYFVPQMQTKVMNEGMASLAHSRIMRNMDLDSEQYMQFATLHTGVLSPNKYSLNPYYLGYTVLQDIERRWDNPTADEIAQGRQPGQGWAKVLEVRETDNDVSFLRNYLTEDLVKELDLYLYRKEGEEWVIVEKDWRKVRDGIVAGRTNFGYPYLVVDDGDYRRNSELYIKHLYEGQEMDLSYAEKTLTYLYQIWGRPVHLETIFDERRVLLTFDGTQNTRKLLDEDDE